MQQWENLPVVFNLLAIAAAANTMNKIKKKSPEKILLKTT